MLLPPLRWRGGGKHRAGPRSWSWSGRVRQRCRDPGIFQEIGEQNMAVFGGDAFRMELHAVDRQVAVAHAHDQAVMAGCVNDQRFGQYFLLDDQRMVRPEEHTSELQSLMRITYSVFCLKKKNIY